MRTSLLSCFVPLLLASCSVDFDTANCGELDDAFQTRVEGVDRSCDVASDCTVIGGSPSYQFCDGYPALGARVGGEPVSMTGYEQGRNHADLAAIIANWGERCAGRKEICNAPGGVTCSSDGAQYPVTCTNHVCTAEGSSCIGLPDAGVGAEVDAGP